MICLYVCAEVCLNNVAFHSVCRSVAHGYVHNRQSYFCMPFNVVAFLTVDYFHQCFMCSGLRLYFCLFVSLSVHLSLCVSVCAGSQRITEKDYDDTIGVVATGG